MQDEIDVVIKIDGVRANRFPRLQTVVKSSLAMFGRKTTVEEVKRGKQALAKAHK